MLSNETDSETQMIIERGKIELVKIVGKNTREKKLKRRQAFNFEKLSEDDKTRWNNGQNIHIHLIKTNKIEETESCQIRKRKEAGGQVQRSRKWKKSKENYTASGIRISSAQQGKAQCKIQFQPHATQAIKLLSSVSSKTKRSVSASAHTTGPRITHYLPPVFHKLASFPPLI